MCHPEAEETIGLASLQIDQTHWVLVPAATTNGSCSRRGAKQFYGDVVSRQRAALRCMLGELRCFTQQLGATASVTGRIKSFASTWHKMKRRRMSYLDIFDAIGARVVVEDIDECYRLLERVHGRYAQIRGQQRDYIVRPKDNGYQSLHTTVRNDEGMPIEIQLRTNSMHDRSEAGAAAHWLYKKSLNATRGIQHG